MSIQKSGTNKVAIVTGAGQGIGKGIALSLAKEGVDVVVNTRHKGSCKDIAAEIKNLGFRSLAVEADITKSGKVAHLVQETIDYFGKVDILINNVGGLGESVWNRTTTEFSDQGEMEWDETFELNLKSLVLMCRAVVPYFLNQKSGRIINIGSMAGKMPTPIVMAYGAAKAGVINFTRSLALELADHNITVNCVCPGEVYTPAWEKAATFWTRIIPTANGMKPKEFFMNGVKSSIPQKRGQTPEDMGYAVTFFASEKANNITGQCLNVDGGKCMY